jgi:hypothetical protein
MVGPPAEKHEPPPPADDARHIPGNPAVFYLKFVKRDGLIRNGGIIILIEHYESLFRSDLPRSCWFRPRLALYFLPQALRSPAAAEADLAE